MHQIQFPHSVLEDCSSDDRALRCSVMSEVTIQGTSRIWEFWGIEAVEDSKSIVYSTCLAVAVTVYILIGSLTLGF
ncbi:hypothetical protein VTL71DRAFT_2527 [Oculimacula yallundae]|uniref:Uncharacterized protein n=1 Tax=Oculimacula yallundae TaxID=86028 RepID=A0ABR4CAH4_9HELO